MSDIGKLVIESANTIDSGDGSISRKYAVAAAFEVIAAKVSSAGSVVHLSSEMDSLSEYADRIQEALNKTK